LYRPRTARRASRGAFTFACDGPDATHGVSSCVLATCSKIPTNGSEFCCIAHAYAVVPSVLPSVATTPPPAIPMSHSDPFGAGAETAAATVAAVATAATVSMASLRASLAELQVELVAHRSEYDDLLRRQAEASPPPSPPQSRPSTPKYFSSTEPARPPPPPRGLVSANTRSATAATSAHAVAAAATAAAATASAVTTAATDTLCTTAHPAFTVAANAAAITTVATAAPPATARPAIAAAATAAASLASAAADNRPTATSAHATIAATAATHATDLPAVAAVATATTVTAATIAGRRKRFCQGYVYTARDKALKVLFLTTKVTFVKRETPSSHTRAMSAMMGTEPPPPPPPSAPPSPVSSPEPSRPSTPSDFPPPPAPPARLLEPLPAFPRPPAPATYAAPNWWAAADRVGGDMRTRIAELKHAIVRLKDHNDRLRRAMVMHTTINRIAAHQMQVLLREDDWDATLEPRSTFHTPASTPAPHTVWSRVLNACHNCSGNPVDTGNGHGPGNHLHRHCTRAHLPPTRPATGTAITVATVVAMSTLPPAAAHAASPTLNATAAAAATPPAVTIDTVAAASPTAAAHPAVNTAATQPAAAINAVAAAASPAAAARPSG